MKSTTARREKPWACTEGPVCPEGDTLDALSEEMEQYQRALERPMLVYADLVPDYDSSTTDVGGAVLSAESSASSCGGG